MKLRCNFKVSGRDRKEGYEERERTEKEAEDVCPCLGYEAMVRGPK